MNASFNCENLQRNNNKNQNKDPRNEAKNSSFNVLRSPFSVSAVEAHSLLYLHQWSRLLRDCLFNLKRKARVNSQTLVGSLEPELFSLFVFVLRDSKAREQAKMEPVEKSANLGRLMTLAKMDTWPNGNG